jgi:glycosyltransferase involved in cell wall biosynthesis
MRILVVSPAFPYPLIKGIKIRLFNILSQLARHHQVELAAMAKPEDPESHPELDAICSSITRLPPPRQVWDPERRSTHFEDAVHVTKLLVRRTPHLVTIHLRPEVERTILNLPTTAIDAFFCFRTYLYPAVAAIAGKRPVLVDFDDVEHLKLADQSALATKSLNRFLDRWESRKLRRWELGIANRADATFVCSGADRDRLPPSLQPKIHVLPNGARFDREKDEELHGKGRGVSRGSGGARGSQETPVANEVPNRLLMIGDMGYRPNVDGAVTFCERVLPRVRERMPDIKLYIVGNHPDPQVRALEQNPGVTVTGFVPDAAPWFQSASVLVVPIRYGGGTRLKILEALRWGRAVVSTPVGCAGLDAESGKHLIMARSDQEFADALVELLLNPERRSQLGRSGRRWARQHFDWDRIGDRLLEVMDQVASSGNKAVKWGPPDVEHEKSPAA